MFCGGVQICEGGFKSANGHGPGGSKYASGFGPGGPNLQGVQICCDTGSQKFSLYFNENLSLHLLSLLDLYVKL